jgi:purine-nucleoside phosphorylase
LCAEVVLSLKKADPRYYEALNWIKERVSSKPKVGVVCGSGLGKFADTLQDVTSFNYKDIPHFPVSTVEGHKVNIFNKYSSSTSLDKR